MLLLQLKDKEMKSLLLRVVFLAIAAGIQPTEAQMIDGICSFYTNNGSRLSWRKKCSLDSFNSGNISFITNNGTMWFMLNDSRNDSYKFSGRIWHADNSYCAEGCNFKSGGDSLTYTGPR